MALFIKLSEISQDITWCPSTLNTDNSHFILPLAIFMSKLTATKISSCDIELHFYCIAYSLKFSRVKSFVNFGASTKFYL